MFKFVCLTCLIATSVTALGAEPFTIMAGDSAKSPKQPQACVSVSGAVNLTFGIGEDVYYCNVDDQKTSAPQIAFSIPNMSLGMRRGPRIANTGTAVVITAIGGAQGKGRDGDILSYRSIDNGMNWLGPVKVNDVEGSAREGLHAMTAADGGTLWCVWLDLRDKGTKLFASKSVDHGASWSANVLVYRSPGGSICECCHPSIVAQKDTVHVLFRNSLKGNRDMYLVSSHDQGLSFGDAVCLSQDHWQLNACPMDGGMLAINQGNQLATVWRRDRNVFHSERANNAETFLGTGEQPWIASNDDGLFTVWTSKRDGDLLLKQPRSTTSEKLSGAASFPVVVATSAPNPSAYVFWEQRVEQASRVMGQRVR